MLIFCLSILLNLVINSALACCLSSGQNFPLPAGAGHPTSIAFSNDGTCLAVGGDNQFVSTFTNDNCSINAGNIASNTNGIQNFKLTYSPQGCLITVGKNLVNFFNQQGNCLINFKDFAPGDPNFIITDIVFLTQNCFAISEKTTNTIFIFLTDIQCTLVNVRSVSTLPSGSIEPIALAYNPITNCLAVLNASNDVVIYSVDTGTCALTQIGNAYKLSVPSTLFNEVSKISFSPSGNCLAVPNGIGNSFSIFPVNSDCTLGAEQVYDLPAGATGILSTIFSPDGQCLAALSSNMVSLFDVNSDCTLTNGRNFSFPTGAEQPSALAFSPDGSCLAVSNLVSSNLTLFKVGKINVTLDPQIQTVCLGTMLNLTANVATGVAPFTFSWSGLPAGCNSINSSTINCDPTMTGIYNITVTVTDSNGCTASDTAVVNVIRNTAKRGDLSAAILAKYCPNSCRN